MENTIIFNRSKIVATVGPACNTKEGLTELVKAGVDVFRLNFSHGTHADHQAVLDNIRQINKELNTHVAVLQDLQGPKIRIGQVENNGVRLERGQRFSISTDDDFVGDSRRVSTTYKALASDVKVNDSILIDDGNIEVCVTQVKGHEVETRVIFGGVLKSRKGMNLPNTDISAPSLTNKDEVDLEFGLKNNVDWIALSFVRSADDIYLLKDKIKAAGAKCNVIAKIEKPEAIENIDDIIAATDALMVARGDLGVEIPMEKVPLTQKMLVEKCNEEAKPVIIATQMMESMIKNPRPTRAEANDVANAVLDGADAVMLSAETAAGDYPREVVKTMVSIIRSVEENSQNLYNKWHEPDPQDSLFNNDSLVRAAARLSDRVHARALVGMTQSGYTAYRLSSHRPKALIYVFTDNVELLPQLNLLWGVRGFMYDGHDEPDKAFEVIENRLQSMGFLHQGDVYISTASTPFHNEGKTNMLKISVCS